MALSDKTLTQYNQEGIFPLPNEGEEAFYKRVMDLEKGAKAFFQQAKEPPPFPLIEQVPYHDWDFSKANIRRLFDVVPSWIAAYYSKKSLAPWQLGMTWIFEEKSLSLFYTLIQVRTRGKKEEVLAHEAVHAIRAPLGSHKYEELFAYMTSESPVRQIFGAIFEEPYESRAFVAFLMLFFASTLLFPSAAFLQAKVFGILLGTALFGGLARLFFRKKALNQAYKALKNLPLSSKNALAILFRLRDEEIDFLKTCSREEIREFVFTKKRKDLRWKQIFVSYLKEVNWS
ncbi:MAG: hypothetical protein AAGI90_05190 [Chlamydiota bacterium]